MSTISILRQPSTTAKHFNNFRPTVCFTVSLSLSFSLCPSLRPRAKSENFHFLKLSANVFYTFPQTPSENAAFPTAFLCECTRRVAGGQSWTKCHHFRWEYYVGRDGSGAVGGGGGGVPLAKLAQASTTTRMTSRSSRRLSATATPEKG